jgi:hypothetical protein
MLMCFTQAPFGPAEEHGQRPPANIEIQIEGGQSVGNYHLFACADNRRLRAFGTEYDRQIGRLFCSQLD